MTSGEEGICGDYLGVSYDRISGLYFVGSDHVYTMTAPDGFKSIWIC